MDLLRLGHLEHKAFKNKMKQKIYLEKGEVPVAFNLSDLQVSHDNLTAVITIPDEVVLVLLRSCGA